MMTAPALSSNLNAALVVAVEISRTAWVIAAHAPGLGPIKIKQRIEPRGEALLLAIERLKRRSAAAKAAVDQVIVAYEAGYSGFWLARLLRQSAIKIYVIRPVSVPSTAAAAGPKRTPSMPISCCGRVLPSSGVSRASARWCPSLTSSLRAPPSSRRDIRLPA